MGTREVSPTNLTPGLIPAQVIGRVWIQQDFLRVAFLDSEWVQKNTPESFWVKMYGGDEQIAAITAPAEEVRALRTSGTGYVRLVTRKRTCWAALLGSKELVYLTLLPPPQECLLAPPSGIPQGYSPAHSLAGLLDHPF